MRQAGREMEDSKRDDDGAGADAPPPTAEERGGASGDGTDPRGPPPVVQEPAPPVGDDNAMIVHESSGWKKPSAEQAQQARREAMFKDGIAPICGTGMAELSSMGVGVTLYFDLLRKLMCVFILMAILSLPTMLIAASGSSVADDERDVLFSVYLTLANLAGSDDGNATTATGPWTSCNAGSSNCTSQKLDLIGGVAAVDALEASYTITACDLLTVLTFSAFLLYFRRLLSRVEERIDRENLTTSDFTVFVRNLPKDATEEEVRKHFSALYQLEGPGPTARRCCRRRRMRPVPVFRLDPEGDPTPEEERSDSARKFAHPWVAQVEIAHPVGGLIRAYARSRKLTQALQKAKARVAMWSEGTEHKKGPNAAKKAKAEAKLSKLKDAFAKSEARLRENFGSRTNECMCAYVVFNHRESLRRCLEDYKGSHSWVKRLLQFEPLRFRGKHPLIVEEAPEPSNIVWENLEYSKRSRRCRQYLTALITVLLLIASFLVVYVAQLERERYKERTVSSGLCQKLPAAFYGSQGAATKAAEDLGLDGIPPLRRNRTLDAACGDSAVALYYPDAPTPSPSLPLYNRTGGAPCLDTCVPLTVSDRVKCSTLACLDADAKDAGGSCAVYPLGARVQCYCRAVLVDMVSQYGLQEGGQRLLDNERDACGSFAQDFALAQSLTIAASLVIVAVNTVLKGVLQGLSRFERHHSLSAQERSTTLKVFGAQFLNTAIIALLVNGRLPSRESVPALSEFGILEGEYSEVNKSWYTAVGVSVTLALLVNTFVQHAAPLLQLFVLGPLKRWMSRGKAITQEDMDNAHLGPAFTMGKRLAVQLNILFTCFLYSSGMPALLLLAAFSFGITYLIDKTLMLRLYKQPPQYDAALARLASSIMTWAVVFHLAMAIYMLGEDSILKSEPVSASLLLSLAGVSGSGNATAQDVDAAYEELILSDATWDQFRITPRLLRLNVFPFALLLFLCVLYKLLRKTALRILWAVVGRCGRILTCCCRRSSAVVPVDDDQKSQMELHMREAHANGASPLELAATKHWIVVRGFNEVYSERVSGEEAKLTDQQKREGWAQVQLERPGVPGPPIYLRYKTWLKDGKVKGCAHKAGQRKRTWEVIRDAGLHSYAMADNPSYAATLRAQSMSGDLGTPKASAQQEMV